MLYSIKVFPFLFMTKRQFKKRWESDNNGGGITFNDIAKCAKAWGITSRPQIQPIEDVCYRVLKMAETKDAEEFLSNTQDQTSNQNDPNPSSATVADNP